MPCLLHIDASARFAPSFSRRGSAAFADAWRATYPSGEVITRDLAVTPVPFITEAWTEVDDFTVINGLSDLDEISNAVADPQQQASWAITRQLLQELYAADAIVIGTPMYNWSVPAPLKAWIDHITFPWVDLAGPPVFIFTARGGGYPADTPAGARDHQEPYLRYWFKTIGVTDITFVHSEYTLAGVMAPLDAYIAQRDEMHATALSRAAELANAQNVADACLSGATPGYLG